MGGFTFFSILKQHLVSLFTRWYWRDLLWI